jgi:hypothetical protein
MTQSTGKRQSRPQRRRPYEPSARGARQPAAVSAPGPVVVGASNIPVPGSGDATFSQAHEFRGVRTGAEGFGDYLESGFGIPESDLKTHGAATHWRRRNARGRGRCAGSNWLVGGHLQPGPRAGRCSLEGFWRLPEVRIRRPRQLPQDACCRDAWPVPKCAGPGRGHFGKRINTPRLDAIILVSFHRAAAAERNRDHVLCRGYADWIGAETLQCVCLRASSRANKRK